jgi:selenide,water dikinase
VPTDPAILVGTETRDDAAVFRLDGRRALVATTDFFSPVVDDAFDFGRVAAANALSDVYAMGARPLFALNLLAVPAETLPMREVARILAGGADRCAAAGISIVGGHSIDDAEPKYGLAVIGMVAPERVLKNVGARVGDVLVLTKPLGSGIVTTAIKRELARPREIREVVEIMATLNRAAAEVLVQHYPHVHACTDVTGFGLAGHLLAMLEGSRVAARLSLGALPILESARRLAAAGAVPAGSRANLRAAGKRLVLHRSITDRDTAALLVADAQTSGGLLAAIAKPRANAVLAALAKAGVKASAIGTIERGRPRIVIDP